MKKLIAKLKEVGFSGAGNDNISLTQLQIETLLECSLDEFLSNGNEYGGVDYYLGDDFIIEIDKDGKVHDVFFEEV